ncbi:hypothetical protein Gotur_025882 [Gossypium turneri]
MVIHNHMVIYPPFPNYDVSFQLQMHHPPPMYHSPQIYPPCHENQVKNALKVKVKNLILLVILLLVKTKLYRYHYL